MFAVPWCKGTKNISSCIIYAPFFRLIMHQAPTEVFICAKIFLKKSYEKICFCAQNFLSLLPISLENGLMSCRGGFMKPSTAINTFISIIH